MNTFLADLRFFSLTGKENLGYMQPSFVRWPSCMVNLPCKENNGTSSVYSACVREKHADAFFGELAKFT